MADPNFYKPTASAEPRPIGDAELGFMVAYTGQSDLDALRRHIVQIWKQAVDKFHVYRCIQQLAFLTPRVASQPAYAAMIARADIKQLKIADIGCAFGQDTRRMILDGVSPENITCIDVTDVYFNLGLELFMDKDKFKPRFICGDFAAASDEAETAVSLDKYGLAGSLDYAVSDAVLHVLSKEQVQNYLSRALRALKAGGVLFGYCVGTTEPGEWTVTPDGKAMRFLHSDATLSATLRDLGFVDVDVTSVDRQAVAAVVGGASWSWERQANEPKRPGEHRQLVFVGKKAAE